MVNVYQVNIYTYINFTTRIVKRACTRIAERSKHQELLQNKNIQEHKSDISLPITD